MEVDSTRVVMSECVYHILTLSIHSLCTCALSYIAIPSPGLRMKDYDKMAPAILNPTLISATTLLLYSCFTFHIGTTHMPSFLHTPFFRPSALRDSTVIMDSTWRIGCSLLMSKIVLHCHLVVTLIASHQVGHGP